MADSDDEGPVREHQLKVVLVGDGTAGKTSIITRFCQNNFDKSYNQTIGIDFFLKRITLPGERYVTLQIWDIGGQTLGGKMLDNYLAGANVIMFVYDVTNYSSFENLDDWRLYVDKCFKDSESSRPKYALVANKADLEHMKKVKKDRHLKYAQEHALSSFFISAKSNDQVFNCFKRMTAEALGVRLTMADIEQTTAVVKADIVQYDNEPKEAPPRTGNTSSMCSLQ